MSKDPELNSALIIIDLIKDFQNEGDEKYRRRFQDVVANTNLLLSCFREKNLPCIHVISHYESIEDYRASPISRIYPPHAIAGSIGADFAASLRINKGDVIVKKTVHSGFYNSDLEHVLSDLKISTLYFAGVHTHVCVLLTIADAFYRGLNIVLVEDCTTTHVLSRHEFAVEYVKRHFGRLIETKELLQDEE